MINLKNNFIFSLFLILLVLIFGCSTGKNTQKSIEDIRIGTEGIVASFVANSPPPTIHVEQGADNSFKVVLQLNNKGTYPQPDEGQNGLAPEFGKLYLSGYDTKIIELKEKESGAPYSDLTKKTLEGKSTINPNGGIDFINFEGKVITENLNVEKYEPTLLATSCYKYNTIASPQVCIDPDPYSTISTKKVCSVNDISLSNQGAPIAVTKIEEEALATKTQFRITVKNVGGGDVIKEASTEKCDPFGSSKLDREDIDKVLLEEATIGKKPLDCGPFAEGNVQDTKGFVRLINGEGSIICKLNKDDYGQTNSAYTSPLKVQLSYIYKTTTDRKIIIKKETGGLSGGNAGSG